MDVREGLNDHNEETVWIQQTNQFKSHMERKLGKSGIDAFPLVFLNLCVVSYVYIRGKCAPQSMSLGCLTTETSQTTL